MSKPDETKRERKVYVQYILMPGEQNTLENKYAKAKQADCTALYAMLGKEKRHSQDKEV